MSALGDFMRAKGLNDEQAAAALRISRPYVTRLRLGKRSPSLKLALEIERWSAGKIPASGLEASKPESGAQA